MPKTSRLRGREVEQSPRLWSRLCRRYDRLVRFGVIGVINTAVYYALFLFFHLWMEYLVAHVTAFVIAMIGSYFLNCYFTFRVRPGWRTFLLFPLSNASNFIVTTVALWITVDRLGLDPRIAAIMVAVVAVPITYLVARIIMINR